MSGSSSKAVRTLGKGLKVTGVVSTVVTVGIAGKNIYDGCNSNLSEDGKIMNNYTNIFSAAGSIGGAYLGTSVGFAAGAETGPGAFGTAALGGYLGSEVGEKLGYWLGYGVGQIHLYIKHKF